MVDLSCLSGIECSSGLDFAQPREKSSSISGGRGIGPTGRIRPVGPIQKLYGSAVNPVSGFP